MPKMFKGITRAAVLAGLLLALVPPWPAVADAEVSNKAPAAVAVGHEWEGNLSQQKEEFIQVVEDQQTWAALWKRAFDQPAPAVDFERHAVACVFLGHSAPWLFSIRIGAPQMRGETMVIEYGLVEVILRLSGPFKAGGQYAMRVVEKTKGHRLVLEEIPFPGAIRRK
jgi:hypothetical protein